jgi:hypothetical protein
MYKNVMSANRDALFSISLAFFSIHLILFLFDLSDPAAFMRADRAMDRFSKIRALQDADTHSLLNVILNSGPPGDFLQHALLFWIGGRYALIVVQIAVQYLTLIITYISAVRLTGSAMIALATGLYLVVMPGTLMDPHLLMTETWFAAFLTFGVLAICESVDSKGEWVVSYHNCFVGFVSLALASSIRPQAMLIPVAITGFLFSRLRRNRRPVLIACLTSYAMFPLAWMVLRFLLAGEFGFGSSNADLPFNLGLRADRILGVPLETTGKLNIVTFINIMMTHPFAAANTIYSDSVNLVLNPGVNHVFGYYLGLFDSSNGFVWNQIRDQSGLLGVVTEILKMNPAFIALVFVWSAIHFIVLLGTIIAALHAFRDGRQAKAWVWVALITIVVVMASSLAAGQVRWSHRAGVEPLLALLAAYGLFELKSAILGRFRVWAPPKDRLWPN